MSNKFASQMAGYMFDDDSLAINNNQNEKPEKEPITQKKEKPEVNKVNTVSTETAREGDEPKPVTSPSEKPKHSKASNLENEGLIRLSISISKKYESFIRIASLDHRNNVSKYIQSLIEKDFKTNEKKYMEKFRY